MTNDELKIAKKEQQKKVRERRLELRNAREAVRQQIRDERSKLRAARKVAQQELELQRAERRLVREEKVKQQPVHNFVVDEIQPLERVVYDDDEKHVNDYSWEEQNYVEGCDPDDFPEYDYYD